MSDTLKSETLNPETFISMKYSIIIALATLLASCTSIKSTSNDLDVPAQVASYPTVADLHVSSQRLSRSESWKWNPFNTTTLKARRGNLKAKLVSDAGADIIVEPEFVQKTSLFNLLGGSLTVTGYPAKLDNFRPATPADIAALQAAGMLYGKETSGGKEVYLVLSGADVSGLVIGKTPDAEQSPLAATNVTNAADTVPVSINTPPSAQTIPSSTPQPSTPQPSTNNPQPSDNSHRPASVNSHRPVAPIAYDAIGTARFLTTMAKEYYGNPDFWPYIYQENQAKFGHPDRIKPGTTVVVPNLNKYGVNPKNPEDVEKAKKLGKEIYARYGKYI